MAGGRNAEGFSDLLMFRVNKLLSDDGYTAGSFAIGLKADEGVSAGVAKPGKASMATIMISSSADLVKAVKSATDGDVIQRSEEHTSELQSLMRISYAVFCLNKKTTNTNNLSTTT